MHEFSFSIEDKILNYIYMTYFRAKLLFIHKVEIFNDKYRYKINQSKVLKLATTT